MEERQARERERYQRPIAHAASGDCKMSFYITPYRSAESGNAASHGIRSGSKSKLKFEILRFESPVAVPAGATVQLLEATGYSSVEARTLVS